MIRLSLLGPIELEGPDGREAHKVLAQTKRLAIFAYLAVSPGSFHRRDTLLALFWPDLDQARARGALNQALRFLRRELSPRVVVSRGDDAIYVDESEVWCDVVALRHHVDAAQP